MNHHGPGIAHGMASLFLLLALAIGLASCGGQPQSGSGGSAQGSANTAKIEECSFFGRMTCKSRAMFADAAEADAAAACFVTRNVVGALVESCGSPATPAPKIAAKRGGESFVSVRLSWSDNSNNEKGFVIERCDQTDVQEDRGKKTASCNSGWILVATVAANVTRYVDKSAGPNRTYLYRVKAINDSGASGYTNEALITAPAK
jgi:hypothetical protein